MEKLTVDDIVVKSPGEQVRRKILQHFETLQDFAMYLGIRPSTLSKYLRGSKPEDIGSNNFRFRLTTIFDESYKSIVKTVEQQVEGYVDEIFFLGIVTMLKSYLMKQ